MQPTGVALVGRTAEQPSEGGSTLQTGHVVSFNRARGKYKVRWEDRTEANFAEDELAQILVNSQEDPYKLADGVPRKRGRPRKTENVPTEELSEQVVAGEAEAADTKPEGLGPTLRKRGRPKGTVKVERRGRPPKTPGTDVEPNVGNEPTDQDGISKAEARLGTKAVAAEKKGAKASGKVTSASPDLPLRRLRERPARGSPEVVSPPRKVAILSEGRRVIEVASGGEEESPVAKGKRRVQTNYKSDNEDEAAPQTTPAKRFPTPAKHKGGLLALPAYPSPPSKATPTNSSPADVTPKVIIPADVTPDTTTPTDGTTDVKTPADPAADVTTPGAASRFLASRARSKLARRDARPLPKPLAPSFPVSGPAALDLLSTYAFLRSFSQALYLSPFTLDDFLAALGCERANPLMDAVHLVLMGVLRPRVEELLAKQGPWEVMFLGRVDWEHLDEITWPEFVLAYLAAAGFFSSAVHKKNFSQTLPRCEYYALPPEAKLEALSFLCDEALTSARIRKPVAEREGRQHDVSFRVTSATPTSSGGKATSPTTENNVTESGKKVTESGGAKGSGEIAGSKPPKVSPAGALRPARITGRLTRFAGKDGGEGTAAQGTDSLQNAAAVETSGGMIAVPAVKPSTESADPEGASQGAEEARQAGGAVGLVAADKTKVGHQNEPAIGLEDGAAANGVGRVGARTDAEGGAVASGEGSAGNRVGSSEPGGDGAADVASASTQGPDRNGARGGGTVPMGPSIAAATNSGETDRSKPEAGLQTHKDSTTPAAPNSSGQQLETPLPNTPGVYAPLPKPALATPSAFSFLKPSANPAATPKTPITQPPSTHPKPQTLPKPREDDSDDANLDECVLCGMEGNLLCCDGCPAAYHARCIGLGKAQLAEGEWFCPECRVTGVNRREPALLGERVEPLGTDPQGRAYWFAFGSVLILDVTPDGPAALPHHYGPSDLHLIAAFLSEGGRAYSRLHSALLARVQEAGLEALLEPPPPPPVEMAAPAKLLGEADKALALPGAVSAAEESRIGDAKTGEQGTALRRDRSDDRSEATEAADIGMTSAEAQAGAGSGPHAELVLKPVQNPSTIPVKPAVSPQSLAAPPFEPPASPPANPPPNPSANTPVNHFASPPLNATAAPGVSPAANAAPNPAVQPPPNPPANLAPNPSSNSVLNPVPSSQSDDRSTPSGVAKETEPTPLPTETQASPSFEGPSVKASGIAVDKRGVEVASAEGSDTVSIAAVPEAGQGAENGRKEGPNPVAGCVSDVRFPSENESGEKSGPRVAKSGPSDGPQGPTESKPEAGRADKKVAAQGIPDETPTSEVRAEGDIKIGSAATIAESVPPPVTEVAGGPEDFVRDGPAMGGSVPLGEASKGEKSSETAAEKEVPESVSGSAKLVEADMAAKKGEGAPVDSAEEPGAAGSAGTTAADVSETQDLAVLHAQTSLTPADEKGGLSEAPVSKVFPSDRIRDAAVQGGTPLAGSVAKRPEEGAAAVSARPGGVASTQTGLPGDTPGAGPGDAPNQVPGEGLGLAGSGDAAVSPNRVTIGGLGSSGLVENGGGSAIQTQLATGDLAGLGLAGLGLSGSGTGSVSLEGLAPAGVSETEPLTCHEPLLFDFDNIEDLVEKLAREQGYLVDTGPLEPAHALTESRGPVGTDVANGPAKQQLIISAPQQIGNETVAATGGLVGSSNGAPSGGLLTTESATRPEQGPSKRQKLDAPLTVADGVSGIQKPPFSLPAGTLAPPHPQPFIPPLNGLRPAVHSQQLQVPLQISNRALAPVQGVPFAVPNHPPALQTLSVRPPVPSQQLGAGTNTPPSHPVLTSAGLAAALRPPAPKLRWPFDDVNQSSARPAPPPATPHTPAAAKGPVSTPAQRPPAGKPLSGMSAAAQTGPVSGGLVLTKGRQAQLAKAGTSSAAAATTGPSVAPIIIKSLKPFERYENRYADGAVAAEAAEKLTAGEKKEAASAKKKGTKAAAAEQSKVFREVLKRFHWRGRPFGQDRCGWCHNCLTTAQRKGCLMTLAREKVARGAPLLQGPARPGVIPHLAHVIYYVMHIERTVRGLLGGPWDGLRFSEKWRASVESSRTVQDLKHPLMELERSLRPIARTTDWRHELELGPQPVAHHSAQNPKSLPSSDASSAVQNPSKSSKPRRKGQIATRIDSGGFRREGVQWYRGGWLVKRVADWERLPRGVLRKAAKKGGFAKMEGLTYADEEALPQRTVAAAWRTRVGDARTLADLALQVRELDETIKWADLKRPVQGPGSSALPDAGTVLAVTDKRTDGSGAVEYLVRIATGVDRTVSDPTAQEPIHTDGKKGKKRAVDFTASWRAEAAVPLFAIEQFEEKTRRDKERAAMAPPPKPRPTPPLSAPPSRPTGPRPGYLNQFYTPRAPRPSPPVTTWVPAQHVYVQSPLYGFPNPWQGPTNPATYQTPGAYQWVAQDGKRPKQAVKRKGQLNPGQQPSTLQPPTNVMPPPQHYAAQNLTPVFTPGLNQGVTQMLTPPVQAAPAGPLGQYFYPGVPTPAALGSTPGALVSNPGGLAANPVPLGVGSMCNYCTGLMGPGKLGARCSQCGGGFHTDCMRVQGNRMVCRQCSERLSQGEKKKKRKTGAEPKPEKGGAVGFATPAAPAQVGAVGGMGPAPFVANGVLGGGSQVVVHPSGGVPELPGTGEGKKHKKASEKGGAEKGVALKQGGTGRQLRLVWTPDQWAPDGAFVTPLKRAELDWARVQESASESDKKREKENADRLADKRFSREAVERFKKLREERYKKRYGEGGLGDVPEAPPQTGEVGELPRSPAAPAPAKRLKPPVRKTPELEKMAADSAVPICRICYENYNAQLWYIACDRCEKWYHGEAFALVLEDAAKLASWRCGKCLKKRTPDGCPYFDPVDALAEPVWIRPKERNERKERKEVKIAYLRDVEGTAQWHMKREREMRQGRPPSAQGGPVEGVFATPQTGEAKPGENQGHTEQGLVVPGGSEPVAEQVLMGAEGAVGGTIPGPAWLDSIMDLDLEGMSFTDMLSVEHPPANTAAPEMATVTKPAGAHVAEPPRGVAGLTLHGSKGADVAPIQGSTVEATSGSGKAGSVPSRLQPFGHVMAAKVERIAAQKRKAEAKAEKKRKAEAEGVEGGQKKGEKTGGLGLDGKGGSKKGGKKGGEKTEIRPGQQEGGEDVPLVLLLGSWGSVEKKKKKKRKKGDAEGAGPSAGSEGERKKKKRRKERNGEEVAPGGSGVAKNPEGVPPASAQDSGNSGAPILIKIAGRGAGQKRGAEGGGEEGKFAKKVSFVASASEKKAKSAGSGGVAKTPSNADPQPGDSEVSTEKKKKRKGVSNDAPAVPPGAKRRRTEGSRKGKSVFVLPAFLAGNEAKNVPLSGGVTAGRSGAREGSEKKPGEKLKGRRKAAARPIVTEAPTGDSVGGEGVPEKGDAVGGSDAQPDERGGTGKEGTQPTYKRLKIKKRPEGGTSEASAQKIEDVAEGSGKQVEGDRGIEGTGGVQALEGVEARTGDAGAAGAKKAGAGSSVLGGDRSSRGEQEGLLAGKSKAVAEERKLSQGAKTSGDNPAKELNEVSERQGKGKEEGVKAAAQPMVKKIRVRIGRGGGALRSGQSEKEEAQTPQREADSLPGEPKLETTDAPTAGGGEEKGERDSAEMGGSLPAEFGRNVGDVAPPPRKTRQQLKDEAAGTLTKPSEGEAKPPVRADAIDTNEGPKGVSKERVKGKGRPGKAEKGKGKQSETAPQGGGGAGKAERGAAPACSVCGLTTGDVATCKGCHVAVHLVCYEYDQRVLAKKGTKGWKCTACRAGIPAGQGACELCSQRGGPLIPTVEGTWAHMTCALWHPQTYIDDQGRVLDVAKVPKDRWKLTCSVCETHEGACIRCSAPGCHTPLHPYCCRKEGLPIFIMPGPKGPVHVAYCRQHANQVA